jgi:hypothetical protein
MNLLFNNINIKFMNLYGDNYQLECVRLYSSFHDTITIFKYKNETSKIV